MRRYASVGVQRSSDLPSFLGLYQVECINAAVAILAVAPEVIRRPHGRDQSVHGHFRIPNPFADSCILTSAAAKYSSFENDCGSPVGLRMSIA
jgi:hypothetical protein